MSGYRMAASAALDVVHLQLQIKTLKKQVSQLQNDVDSLRKTAQLKEAGNHLLGLQTSVETPIIRNFPSTTTIEHGADAETEGFCLQTSKGKDKVRDSHLVTNIHGIYLPPAMRTAVKGEPPVMTNKEENAEKQDVAKKEDSRLRTSKRKQFDRGLVPAGMEDLMELMELDFTQPPGEVMSKEVQNAHRSYTHTQSLLDSPNPEMIFELPLPAEASYPENSLDSLSPETELLVPAKARLNSSAHQESPAFGPVSTEPKAFKNVWKGSLDSSIHAVPPSQVSGNVGIQNFENHLEIFDKGLSSLTLRGIVPAQSSTVNQEIVEHGQENPGHGQSRGCQDRLSLSREPESVLWVESSTHAAPPLVSHNSLDRTIGTQFSLLHAYQSTETSQAIPEGSVKEASAMPSNRQDHGLSIPVAVPVVNKEQLEVAQRTTNPSVPSLHTPLEPVMASKHQDPPSAIKYDLSALNEPTEGLFEQLLVASKAFDERSDARREAAKKEAPLEEVFDAFKDVDLPEWRKPTFTRDLGSVLDPESRRMVLRPSTTLPTPPAQSPPAGRLLSLTFKRVIVKLLLPNGAIKTMGHLDRPTYPHAELSMHLYISKNKTASVTLVARIYSTGNDFLVLNTASTRPMLEFNVNFMLPGTLDTDTVTINTVPIAEQTEFAPSSPLQAEIQNLRDPLTKQLLGNLRHISFAFTEKNYTLPEVEDLPHRIDAVEHTQWDTDAVEFFEFIYAFRGQTRKVLTLLFTDEHPTETVDEMMTVISKNCNLQRSLWYDHGVTWQVSENAEGNKIWLLKSHTSPLPHL